MERQVILAVGHGSRVPAAIAEAQRFTDALAKQLGQEVSLCFLELADPDLMTGLADAAERVGKRGRVVILPLFLSAAGHYKNDIAATLRWARAQFPATGFIMATPLGPHAYLVELMAKRIDEALATTQTALASEVSAVLLVGRGSSDPSSNSEVARVAYILSATGRFLTVEYAFQAVARPTVAEGVRRCALLGAQQVIVTPYLLFTGDVDEEIRRSAAETARSLNLHLIHASYLGVHPLLIEVARQRLAEALEGRAAMNCDLCKYRFPPPGYEGQVGQPQAADYLRGTHKHDHGHEKYHTH
ncbi:MAG: sirohydrochlorin chelatase [Anaerolineae bacterium]|nr:sirohydrochlorin chelatase [Anaerolineae bacterium]MDW8100934.1 sirohydrochlorin chelatase [Anaerolineae bacterium]